MDSYFGIMRILKFNLEQKESKPENSYFQNEQRGYIEDGFFKSKSMEGHQTLNEGAKKENQTQHEYEVSHEVSIILVT